MTLDLGKIAREAADDSIASHRIHGRGVRHLGEEVTSARDAAAAVRNAVASLLAYAEAELAERDATITRLTEEGGGWEISAREWEASQKVTADALEAARVEIRRLVKEAAEHG